ncbi:hypothetical protein [Streptomyces sp. NPDC086023]|uniref:hypothetical protein n=1 Tax=Streptomyces sp. NPDC086023 TaxID=3365746 RepID=UPI0037D74995
MKYVFRLATLTAAVACAAGLAVSPVSAAGLDDPIQYSPVIGSVVFNNGDNNVTVIGNDNNTAGRDNLEGSNHVAGQGHLVGLTSPTFTQMFTITNHTGQALTYSGCDNCDYSGGNTTVPPVSVANTGAVTAVADFGDATLHFASGTTDLIDVTIPRDSGDDSDNLQCWAVQPGALWPCEIDTNTLTIVLKPGT